MKMECLFLLLSCFLLSICLGEVMRDSSSQSHHQCFSDDRLALLQFKYQFSSTGSSYVSTCRAAYSKTSLWNESSSDCCIWDGVTCHDSTGHVIGLDLACSQLQGTFHPNSSLFRLHHLRVLNLAFNNFLGSLIPAEIGWLKNLVQLNLSFSSFSGRVPSNVAYLVNLVSLDLSSTSLQFDDMTFTNVLGNLTKLEVLSLSSVNISSKMPLNVSSSLIYLDFQGTGLLGEFPLNSFSFPNLQKLSLSSNLNLYLELTKFNWSSVGSSLLELDLSYTNTTGKLPDSLGNVKSLKYLTLSNCKLFGSIPENIGNLKQVMELDLSHNNLSGHLPWTISKLKRLTEFDLSFNSLQGEIPDAFAGQQQLSYLFLRNNLFSGQIPPSVFSLLSLTQLSLSHNQLQGPVSSSISKLVNLAVIDLSSNKLSGDVGMEMFSSMKGLGSLDLSYNNLSWSQKNDKIIVPYFRELFLSSCRVNEFPVFLRKLDKLYALDLSNNEISGQIPYWVKDLSRNPLRYLYLSDNFLTGGLEHLQHFNQTAVLDLNSNLLQGPLPLSICNLSSLAILDFSGNKFDGGIPECLLMLKGLTVLDLGSNNFQSSIPTSPVQGNSTLRILSLSANQLEGRIPRSLINFTMLEVLDLGNNKISDTFPTWLETLPYLRVLILRHNRFHSPIGSSRSLLPFPSIRIFDLSHNDFTGTLPAHYLRNFKAMMNADEWKMYHYYMDVASGGFNYNVSLRLTLKGQDMQFERIFTAFTSIDLSSNRFQGEVPQAIGDLASLLLLNLSHNILVGSIPDKLGSLDMLQSLDLSWNQFTGKIPEQLANLTFLAVLDLSQNRLVGRIPQGKQFNTFSNDSYDGNFDLCGFPLSKDCGESSVKHVPPPSMPEQKDGSEGFASAFSWRDVLMGCGCGLVFGFIMGLVILRIAKPKWLINISECCYQKFKRY